MNKERLGTRLLVLLCGLFATLLAAKKADAHDTHAASRQVLADLGFDQRLGAEVPQDLVFTDEAGQPVTIQQFLGNKPVILTLGYLHCPNLCSLVRSGMEKSLHEIQLDAGKDFEVLVVSIDPSETPTLATNVKRQVLADYGRPGTENGWHFLTGQHEMIDRLAAAVGFRYAYDAEQEEFAHASGLVVLTPQGKVARYLYGIEFPARDLRLALVEAADNKIGSPVDQLLLFCYHYNPSTGKYDLLIMSFLRLAGLTTVAALGLLLYVQTRRQSQVRLPWVVRNNNGSV
ncbi:MAG: SCO family protein [Caldilineaceae bacterium]